MGPVGLAETYSTLTAVSPPTSLRPYAVPAARLAAGGLGQHHGRVGRHVAVRALARRLDHDAGLVDPGRQHTISNERVVGGTHSVQDGGKDVPIAHGRRTWVGSRRLTQFR